MDSSPTLPVILLDQLLERERGSTCQWLRGSMVSLVDPLVNELFHKLKRDLTTALLFDNQSNGNGNYGYHNSPANSEQVPRKDNSNHQQITNIQATSFDKSATLTNPLGRCSFSQRGPMHFDDTIFSHNQQQPSSNISPTSLVGNSLVDTTEEEPIIVKEESNETTTTSQYLPNEESNSSLFDEDEEDCDCDDCINGGIIKKEEDNDDDDDFIMDEDSASGQVNIETEDQMENDNTNTAKRPRLEQQCLNNNNVSTLSLKCSQSNCEQMFTTKTQLDQHLLMVHSIEKYRCIVKDCNVSFADSVNLSDHLKKYHSHSSKWNCSQCDKHYRTHKLLHTHFATYHQEGQYQCSFADCGFTGEYKGKVLSHVKYQHKRQEFVCPVAGCGHRNTNITKLKDHQRAHLGIEPFRCKWIGCGFTSSAREYVLKHIQRVHFANSRKRFCDLKDYLEVMHHLL